MDSTSGQNGVGVTVAETVSGTTVAHGGSDGDSGRDVAGLVLARLSVLPALLAVPWLMVGFLLLAVGCFRPVPAACLAAALAMPVLYAGLRAVPAPPGPPARTPWWTVIAVLTIVVAFLGYQAVYHSQFVFVSRDPGAYFQFANWIADHGSLRVPQDAAVFGTRHGGALVFSSGATYQTGNSVVLQFMAGLPLVLAGAMWAAGQHAALLMPALLGALAVLTLAGLTARLIGARWAPLATLVAAVSLPMQFTSRSDYSEPLAEILLLGGLSLVTDSLRGHAAPAGPGGTATAWRERAAAALGGFILGLTILVRIDGASDILPAIPYCGALFVRRRPQAAPLAIGLATGAAIGITEGLAFSRPYLMQTNRDSVLPLAGIAAIVLAATAAGTVYYRHRPLPQWRGWLDKAALVAPFLIMTTFALRPYLQYVHGVNLRGTVVRTYAEISLNWVDWYLGLPVILIATASAALLTRAVLRGQARSWALPLMILAWATVTVLYQPGVTPDQPWASRRLVPAVIPAFVLLAVWALARGSAWMHEHWPADAPRALVIALCGVLVAAPAAVTNWGLELTASTANFYADGLSDKRTYQGELGAIHQLCAVLPARSAVVFVGAVDANLLEQPVRSMCGVPAAGYLHDDGHKSASYQDKPGVLSVVRDIQSAGRVPVLLGHDKDQLKPYLATGSARQVFVLHTTRDADSIRNPPTRPVPMMVKVWMWTPTPGQRGH